LFNHLLDQITEREISADHSVNSLTGSLPSQKFQSVRWFKRFPEMIVCGDCSLDNAPVATFATATV